MPEIESSYNDFFLYMAKVYNLVLTDGEMEDIIALAVKTREKQQKILQEIDNNA